MQAEPIGYLAASLVLATFCMRGMVSLRLVAIASNVAFIAYGHLAHLDPVLLLHVLLLPVNALRLAERLRGGPAQPAAAGLPPDPVPHPFRRADPAVGKVLPADIDAPGPRRDGRRDGLATPPA